MFVVKWHRAWPLWRVVRTNEVAPCVKELHLIAFKIECFLIELSFALSKLIFLLLKLQFCQLLDALPPPTDFFFTDRDRRITGGLTSRRILISGLISGVSINR
jgi:hypothetical protein